MSSVLDLITNPIFVCPAAAWLISQISKIIGTAIRRRGLHASDFGASGGMPSSHTATVTALLFATGIRYGLGGFEFPMTMFFAVVVIYDALGVRRETGRQSAYLNRLISAYGEKDRAFRRRHPFRENIGHTLPQVLVGAVIGIACGILISLLLQYLTQGSV